MNPLRGIGLLSVLLALGCAGAAVAIAAGQGWSFTLLVALGGALLTATIGVSSRTIRRGARVLAWVGMGLTLVSLAIIAITFVRGPWVNSNAAGAAPAGLGTTSPGELTAPTPPAIVAGTIAYLLKQGTLSYGNFPLTLHASESGLVVTPGGSVQLPAGAVLTYESNGTVARLSIAVPSGEVARWDSETDQVTVD